MMFRIKSSSGSFAGVYLSSLDQAVQDKRCRGLSICLNAGVQFTAAFSNQPISQSAEFPGRPPFPLPRPMADEGELYYISASSVPDKKEVA